MKRYRLCVLILVALFAVSCSSTPETPETEAPVEAVEPAEPDQQTDSVAALVAPVSAPEEELLRAENLRKAIDEYGLSFALPDEYQEANGEFDAGKAAMGVDNGAAKNLLDSAGSRYQVVFDAAIDQGSKKRLDEIAAAKSQADTVKAARAASDQYKLGEDKTAESRQLLEQKQYLEAWESSGVALSAYNQSFETARAKRDNAAGELNKTASAQENTNARLEEVDKEIGGETE
ncbi:MAG: hypothetical protein LBK44_02785 [Spirochaetales bacterium]|nr:hypothetical protein [Spirochaetales bacterium]